MCGDNTQSGSSCLLRLHVCEVHCYSEQRRLWRSSREASVLQVPLVKNCLGLVEPMSIETAVAIHCETNHSQDLEVASFMAVSGIFERRVYCCRQHS